MSVPLPPFDDNSEINDEQWKIWFSQLCDTLKTDSGWMNPAGTTSVPGGNPSFSADKMTSILQLLLSSTLLNLSVKSLSCYNLVA